MNLENLIKAKEDMLAALADIAKYPEELGFDCTVKCAFTNGDEVESENPEDAACIFGEITVSAPEIEESVIFGAAAGIFEGEEGLYFSSEEFNGSIADARREVTEYFDKLKAAAEADNITAIEAYKKCIDEENKLPDAPKVSSNKHFYITAGIGAAVIFIAFTLINILLKKG